MARSKSSNPSADVKSISPLDRPLDSAYYIPPEEGKKTIRKRSKAAAARISSILREFFKSLVGLKGGPSSTTLVPERLSPEHEVLNSFFAGVRPEITLDIPNKANFKCFPDLPPQVSVFLTYLFSFRAV